MSISDHTGDASSLLTTRHASLPMKLRPTTLVDQQLVEQFVLNLKGRELNEMCLQDRQRVIELAFQYWRRRGFPYSSLNDSDMVHAYSRLEASRREQVIHAREIRSSMLGVGLANCFHPQMWTVKIKGSRAPFDCFTNDAALKNLICKALNVWQDRSAVNASNLRRMLATFSHTSRVSNFRPTAAKAIYESYSRDGDIVVDFSAGYGGRMLGCFPLDRLYVGIDPCLDQIKGLRNMKAKLGTLVKLKARTRLHRACAENFLSTIQTNSVALVFSSPPYFDLERYSNEKSQSYIKFPAYEQWLTEFLGKIFCESRRILKRGGYMVVNVADVNGYELTADALGLATKYFKLVDTLKLRLSHLPYQREHPMKAYKHEPVFVFRKS
jgi:hypothetical protein